MTEEKYKHASEIVRKAEGLTKSIDSLQGAPPDTLEIRMEALEKQDHKKVQVFCLDGNNPNDIICQIHQLLLDDMIQERDQLQQEFEEL